MAQVDTTDAALIVYEPERPTYAQLPAKFATYAEIPAKVATYADLPLWSGQFPSVTEAAFVVQQFASSDSGTTTEAASVEITHIYVSDADSGTDTESTLLLASGITVSDSSDVIENAASPVARNYEALDSGTATESASLITHDFIVVSEGISTTEIGLLTAFVADSDVGGVDFELGYLSGVGSSDALGASESVQIGLTLSDAGLVVDTAVERATEASSDIATGRDAVTLTAKLSDDDENGPTDEIFSLFVLGSRPIGNIPSITAIDGVDRTSITSAGLSTTTLTDVNEPDRCVLLDVNSIESGILIAVNAVDRG